MQIIKQTELEPGDVFLMPLQRDLRLAKVQYITKSGSIRYSHGTLEDKEVTENNVIYYGMRDLAPVDRHDSVKYLQKPYENLRPVQNGGNAVSWAKPVVLIERNGMKVG